MNINKLTPAAFAFGLVSCLLVVNAHHAAEEEDREGVEVLARGPLHEAYAAPLDTQPKESPLVRKEPPEPIEEQPPDQRPEGDNIVWIPGYWAWDGETADFLWISGFWREAPPGRRWVAGHWQKVSDEGWRWMSGFWALEQQEEVLYVPPPPESLERGPTTERRKKRVITYLAAGSGERRVMSGGRASGCGIGPTGSGVPPPMSGRRPAASLSRATGTIRCTIAVYSSRRSVLIAG